MIISVLAMTRLCLKGGSDNFKHGLMKLLLRLHDARCIEKNYLTGIVVIYSCDFFPCSLRLWCYNRKFIVENLVEQGRLASIWRTYNNCETARERRGIHRTFYERIQSVYKGLYEITVLHDKEKGGELFL